MKIITKNVILERNNVSMLANGGLAIGVGVIMGLSVLAISSPLKLLAIVVGLAVVLITVLKVEFGLLLLVFTTYTNMSTVLVEHGVPSVAKILVSLLILGIMVRFIIHHERPAGWGTLALLLTVYGVVGSTSFINSADSSWILTTLTNYAKASIIAIITVVLLKRSALLRGVIWALLASGILLGSIGVYQYLTGTFENSYWGFGLAGKHDIVGAIQDYRIAGPLGDSNFFAQYMLPLVPLGFDRLWGERKILLKILASWALAASLLVIFFTYSRGAFLALFVMLVAYLVLHPRQIKVVVFAAAIATSLLLVFSSSRYVDRMKTLEDLLPGTTQHKVIADSSYQGRLSEILVACHIFADHPLNGIGLGCYPYSYQKYAQKVALDFRLEGREAHSLYLQILAETGLLGFSVFGIILWIMFYGLWQARKEMERSGMTDLKRTTTALGIGLIGFLTAAIFLHLAFAELFWLLVGTAYAVPHITKHEMRIQKDSRAPGDAIIEMARI